MIGKLLPYFYGSRHTGLLDVRNNIVKFKQPFAMSQYLVTDKVFYRRAISLIIPVALQYCISMGVNMMDTIMVGRLGEVAISATSLAN